MMDTYYIPDAIPSEYVNDGDAFELNGTKYPPFWPKDDKVGATLCVVHPCTFDGTEYIVNKVCNGGEISWDGVARDPSEVAAAKSQDEIAAKSAANAPFLAQIDALDNKRIRPAAEIAASLAAGTAPDAETLSRLVSLNTQIAALRDRLVK